jgi:hypothetical protein
MQYFREFVFFYTKKIQIQQPLLTTFFDIKSVQNTRLHGGAATHVASGVHLTARHHKTEVLSVVTRQKTDRRSIHVVGTKWHVVAPNVIAREAKHLGVVDRHVEVTSAKAQIDRIVGHVGYRYRVGIDDFAVVLVRIAVNFGARTSGVATLCRHKNARMKPIIRNQAARCRTTTHANGHRQQICRVAVGGCRSAQRAKNRKIARAQRVLEGAVFGPQAHVLDAALAGEVSGAVAGTHVGEGGHHVETLGDTIVGHVHDRLGGVGTDVGVVSTERALPILRPAAVGVQQGIAELVFVHQDGIGGGLGGNACGT